MRVVIVSGIFPPDIGGPATHALDLLTEFRRRGHGVTILTLTDEGRGSTADGVVRWTRRWPWFVRDAAAVAWLVRNRSRYDAVYTTGMQHAAVAGARLAGRPVMAKMVADPAWECATRRGFTTDDFDTYQTARPTGFGDRLARFLRTWTVRQADAVTVSTASMDWAVKLWQAGTGPAVVRIPNGVLAPEGLPPRRPARAGELDVLFVGRLIPLKRVEILLEVLARSPRMRLTIVGDGPDRPRLAELTDKLGVSDRVRFAGALPQKEVLAEAARADVVALPSEYEGGLPHVVLEAFVMGAPVVATPVGGTAEVIVDGENGFLVEPTPEAFTKALDALQHDPERLDRMAEAARRSGERWAFANVCNGIEGTLAHLAGRSGRQPAKPRMITIGKIWVGDPPDDATRRRFETVARHLDATFVNAGPFGARWHNGVRVISWPQPGPIGHAFFYAAAPVVGVALAASRPGSAVVCQSPYEAVGVLTVRRLVPRRRRPRVVVEAHSDWGSASRWYGSRWRRLLSPAADAVARWSLRRADRVRVIGAYTEQLVRQAGCGGPIDSYPTFSEFGAFLEKPVTAPPRKPTAIFVGVLQRVKAPDLLLAAWKEVHGRLPEAKLRIVGSGPMEAALRRRAVEAGLGDSVEFVAPVAQRELVELIDASTCLVLPSNSEGLGRVVLEAMARARAVVGSGVGGIPEMVEDGVTGRLFTPGDRRSLAAALIDVLGDTARAGAMGQAGRARMEARDPAAEYEAGLQRLASWVASR